MKTEILEVAGHRVKPGEKIATWVTVCEDGAGPLRIPLLLCNGTAPGKSLYLVAGLYGDEFTGTEAILRVFERLDPATMRGRLLAVPLLNIPGFERLDRVGHDALNMNRVGAGNQAGALTERLVSFLVDNVVAQADHGIELIDIGLHYAITNFVTLGDPANLDYCRAYGSDLLWTGSAAPTVLRQAVAQRGVKVFMTEVGGQGQALPENVALEARGIEGVMAHLQMLPGTPPMGTHRVFDGFWMRSRHGGLFRCRLQLRQQVRAGETLATIHDLLGRELERITAPHDGIVIGYRTVARIRPGDWTIWIGRFSAEQPA